MSNSLSIGFAAVLSLAGTTAGAQDAPAGPARSPVWIEQVHESVQRPPAPEPEPEVEQAEPPKVTAAPEAGPPVGGRAVVQVGAFPRAAQAQRRHVQLAAAYARSPAALNPVVRTVQINGLQVSRAIVEGFASAHDAESFCQALKTDGQPCLVRIGTADAARPKRR